jgi:hypothetical protein
MAPESPSGPPLDLLTLCFSSGQESRGQPGARKGLERIQLSRLDDKDRPVRTQVRETAQLFKLALRGGLTVEMQCKAIPRTAFERHLAARTGTHEASTLTSIVSTLCYAARLRVAKPEQHAGQERPKRALAGPVRSEHDDES